MINVAKLHDMEKQKRIFGQARILTVDNEKRTAKIYLDSLSGIQEIHAVLALSFEIELVRGDKVLVVGEDFNTIYIIGVLSVKSPAKTRSKNGAYALLADAGTGSRTSLQIFSKHNELVVEYDTENNKTKVNSGTGDLEFSVPAGNIAFQSSKSVVLKGETISLEGRQKIDLAVQGYPGSSMSSLSLGKHQTKLSSPDLRITARRGNLFIDELKITGKKILSNLIQATIKVDKLETKAQSIISKAKNMYQSVENLSQLKTGRLKTLIKSTYHLKSKNTVMKSEDDFKIKAEKIDLG